MYLEGQPFDIGVIADDAPLELEVYSWNTSLPLSSGITKVQDPITRLTPCNKYLLHLSLLQLFGKSLGLCSLTRPVIATAVLLGEDIGEGVVVRSLG